MSEHKDIDEALDRIDSATRAELSEREAAELSALLRELRERREAEKWKTIDETPAKASHYVLCWDHLYRVQYVGRWNNHKATQGKYWRPLPTPPGKRVREWQVTT